MITQVFLDLDDVLNKFTMHALAQVGCNVDPESFDDYDPVWGWDIVRAANELHPYRKFTAQSFWAQINRGFWSSLPKSDEFDDLILFSEKAVGKENVIILSCPIEDPDCLAGKVEWIHYNCPEWMRRQYLIGPPKWCCAGVGSLLIDDKFANVSDFRVCGGDALLMPRPWNKMGKNLEYFNSTFWWNFGDALQYGRKTS